MKTKQRLARSASLAAVCVALILIAGKGVAWYVTGSLSLKASLIDSVLDGLASLINLVALYHASRPADDCHRFGHEKAEALASLGQSVFIALTAFWLLAEAYGRLQNPVVIPYNSLAMGIMVFSTLCTVALVVWQRYVIKQTQSLVIQADALHYKTDILTNLGVLIVLGITSLYHVPFLDSLVGALIAVYILLTSREIAQKSADILMDRELDEAFRSDITRIVMGHPQTRAIQEMRTRSAGQKKFIQLRLALDQNLTLRDAHAIAKEIKNRIIAAHPEADVIIHKNPQ